MVNGFIFMCDNETENECFGKMLFGSTKRMYRFVFKIKKGDLLFLYNYESEMLHGIFVAGSNGQMYLDRKAWKGKFPSQVKVELKKAYPPIEKKKLEKLPFIKFQKRGYVKIFLLKGEKLQKTLELFE